MHARPAHSSQKNRIFDPENFANRALQRHYPTLSVPRPIRRHFLNLPPPDTLGYKLDASLCPLGRGSRDEPGNGLTRRFGIPGASSFAATAEGYPSDRLPLPRLATCQREIP